MTCTAMLCQRAITGGDGHQHYLAGVVVILGFVAIFSGIVAIVRTLSRKRTQAFATAAVEAGFTFCGEDWPDKSRAPHLQTALFSYGQGQQFKNIMTGSRSGFRTSVFDYFFTTGGGRDRRTVMQTVATFSKDGVFLPYFSLRPVQFLDKAWDAVAHKNIHFESDPEFARRYALQGASPEKVRALFAPSLLSFIESLDTAEKWHIESAEDTLVVYRAGKRVAPEKLREFLDQTSSIATSFFSFADLAAASQAPA